MEQIDDDSVRTARCLLRSARVGTLATSAKGQPFASLVTPACAPDLSLLLLLSGLSEHTRHLVADPRCSVLVVGAAETANPQTAPRLTVTGVAERVEVPELKSRYLAVHPYASLYADFGDFAVWRMQPVAGLFVGGFARAIRLPRQALTPDAESVATIAAAEAGIIAHCNRDHPDAMAAIAGQPGDWQMVTADVDGFDLAQGERVLRFAWSAPVRVPADVRRELVLMTRAARGT
jgi:putative heme iron utilization protein